VFEQFVEMKTDGTEPFLREEPLVYQRREGGYIDPPISGEVGQDLIGAVFASLDQRY
jgi:hypothetical protein